MKYSPTHKIEYETGAGMDMVFHVLYETAGVVHPGRPNTWRREVL